ncbi:MAG: metallophosphoesterase [Bacilli bacterium]|nr:metallophosphoesterase [Bacilli bacterium]
MIYIITSIVIVLILFIIYCYYEDFKVQKNYFEIEAKEIKKDYKIIQISDFHNEKNKWLHKQIIEIIKKEKPNIIVITGDLIDIDDIKYAKVFIEEIHNLAPIYYAPGNHEYLFGGYEDLRKILIDNNVNVLENNSIKLDNNIIIHGIKDPISGMPNDEDDVMKENLNSLKFTDDKYDILLSHRPEYFDMYTDYNVDLVFTGHAHGGQFRLPLFGSIFSPDQGLLPKYAMGMHIDKGTKMIVSRGLGNSMQAFIRINNRPELIIVSLLKK